MVANPYAEALAPFFGRQRELDELERDLTRGASALGAVMGGRGMGKTSIARVLGERLRRHSDCELHWWPLTPPNREDFLLKLGRSLSFEFTGRVFDEEVQEAIRGRPARRVVMLLDEVDGLISSPTGRLFLESIRVAWEQLHGRLGVVILGGSSLYELLESNVSPFLRNARFVGLGGLSRAETAQLIREPCGLEVADEMIELVWQETAGHPAVLTEIMREFIDRASDPKQTIISVIDGRLARLLETKLFEIWWNNLRPRGQEVYRRLIDHGKPVATESVAAVVGGAAGRWVQVLETTGVVRSDGGELLPRGELFARWVRREHFGGSEPTPPVPEHVQCVGDFEASLIGAIARWSQGIIEYASLGLLLKSHNTSLGMSQAPRRGNTRFMPEAHFQLSLLLALQQNG